MGIMYHPDGTSTFVMDNDDFADMIGQKLGFEAYSYVNTLIAETEVAAHQADSDFKAYEMQVEEMRDALLQIQDMISKLEKETNNKKVSEAAKNIYSIVAANV
jgi:hypothetical protein